MTDTYGFYIAKLKHDRGTIKIRVYATSIDAARRMICAMENCPDRAIVEIKPAKATRKQTRPAQNKEN